MKRNESVPQKIRHNLQVPSRFILPRTELTGAATVAEQIRKAISSGQLKDKTSGEAYGKITISIGIAQFFGSDLPYDLIHRADKALYLAKSRGRNQIAGA